MELTNARIVIAGATGELGSSLAHALSDRGATLGLAGRSPDALDTLGAELDAPTARFDARDPASCRTAIDALAAALSGLDALVIACGATAFGGAQDVEPEVVDELFRINATGPMALTAAALAHMED